MDAAARPGAATGASAAPEVLPDLPPGYEAVPVTRVRLRARRRAIARNLEVSSQIPSLTADMQMDLEPLLAARAEHNAEHSGHKLSVLAFVSRATVATINEFPNINATYTESTVLLWNEVNLGVAVDAPNGLVVPVVRGADRMSAAGLGSAIASLATRARNGDLTLDDLTAGTFTISNPGSVGPVIRAEALINPPQVALLGLPALKKVPVVTSDEDGDDVVAIKTVICPSLTFDHRVLDGGEVIRFLNSMRRRIEEWTLAEYMADPSVAVDASGPDGQR